MLRATLCAVLLFLTADPSPLENDAVVKRIEEAYKRDSTTEYLSYLRSLEQIGKRREKALSDLLEKATRAGDFDRATALKRLIDQGGNNAVFVEPSQSLTVYSATWGVNQSIFDVTDKVRQMVGKQNTWKHIPTNDEFGVPAPGYGVGNTLIVRYGWGGKIGVQAVYEGHAIVLP